jgi:hypothetical protein
MLSAGSAPRTILAALLHINSDVLISTSDISNERETARRAYLKGRSPIEALIDELNNNEEWISSVELDSDRKVKALFFAHVSQVELYRANPDLLALDCTYKTNRYNMPLLHFLGVSSIGKYFSATFCFLSGEEVMIMTGLYFNSLREYFHWILVI